MGGAEGGGGTGSGGAGGIRLPGGKVNICGVAAVTGGTALQKVDCWVGKVGDHGAEPRHHTDNAYHCCSTRKEDAGWGAEPFDALRRRALLRSEVPEQSAA